MNFKNVLIFGAPGCGKGTQSILISTTYNLLHLSTGDLLREVRLNRISAFYEQVNEKMSKGELVGDDILYGIVSSKISETIGSGMHNGIIYDGFPRNDKQADFLTKELENYSLKIDIAIFLDASEEIVVERVINRFSCSNCAAVYNKLYKPPKVEGICDVCHSINSFDYRVDDTVEIIKNRLNIFNQNIKPLKDYYSECSFEVDASLSSDKVFEKIKKILEK